MVRYLGDLSRMEQLDGFVRENEELSFVCNKATMVPAYY